VLREGQILVHHADRPSVEVSVPSLLFYPRALSHRLVVPRDCVADIMCATVAIGDTRCNPLAEALPDYVLLPLSQLPSMQQVLNLLFNEAFHDKYGRQLILDRLCDVLVVQLIRHALEAGDTTAGILSGLSDPGLSRVLAAIHADPSSAWTLDRMAELAGMSRTRFAMRFHQFIGITPADYLANWRISMAQALLDKSYPVRIVALDIWDMAARQLLPRHLKRVWACRRAHG
jgi:AraC-like DNA-binding protein